MRFVYVLEAPLQALRTPTLSAQAKIVYALIFGNPNEPLPIDRICATLHLGQRTVIRAIRELEQQRVIDADRPKKWNADKLFTRPTRYKALLGVGGRTAKLNSTDTLHIPGGGRKSRTLLVALFDSSTHTPVSAAEVGRRVGISTQEAQRARRDLKRYGFMTCKP